MHEGMGGPHLFEITVESDSPITPSKKLYFRAFWGEKPADHSS